MNSFWQSAARGGFVIGLIAVVAAALKTVAGGAGLALSLAELFAVAWCIYVFGKRHGEQTYGQAMGFVMAQMLFAGVIYGVGYYFLVNFWAVDFFTQQIEKAWEAMSPSMRGADKAMVYKMWGSPAVWMIYGIMAEVIYGGMVGLFVVLFYRARQQ